MKPEPAASMARKVLVFAHVPPPQHGQSVMVQALLDGLRSDSRFEVYHVDARMSDGLDDVGSLRAWKVARLVNCVMQAWWIRLRHGPMSFYYVPAPAKLSAVVRDWIVMALCRPFFRHLVLHWHAFGLGEWVNGGNDWKRGLTRRLLGKADLAIVLNEYNKIDAEVFSPERIRVVPNGIEDLFPDYRRGLDEKRRHRSFAIKESASGKDVGRPRPESVQFLFLGHLTKTKGVFVSIQATAMLNAKLRESNAGWRAHLILAGSFVSADEQKSVMAAIGQANEAARGLEAQVVLAGFLNSGQKKTALERADCLVFPTYYENEAQPLVLLEAMSAGLPVITTSWRGISSVLPEVSRSVVEPTSAAALCQAMLAFPELIPGDPLRRAFERDFTLPAFASRACDALAG